MASEDSRKFEFRAKMFKALAHPVRLYILERLKERPWCVCEIAAEAGVDKSIASKHLAQLKDAGLVDDERHGTLVEYRLVAPCVLELAACAERAARDNMKRKLDRE